jgi:hypothetical protein
MLSNIRQRVYVECPPDRAKQQLAEYFAGSRSRSAERWTLHAPYMPPAGEMLWAHADVNALVDDLPGANGSPQALRVRWTPVSGPFPRFEGTLTTEGDDRYPACVLVLEGSYRPPFGVVGAAFDALLGRRIAIASARELLHEIAARLEADYKVS